MDFSLLGRVELTVDGRPVTIGAARPLTVLAMLLLNANQVVSAGRLIDALWDQSPPRTAGSQVQITISALRRLLRSPGDAVIETRSPGYLMHVPDEALDLRHFEFLAAQGAAAASERRPGEAAGTLRDALGLWRGPAMDGLDSTVIRTAAARLNERRLAVQQDCLELELQLGGHREVIGELTMLTAEAPLHERFRAQLMLALYRAGPAMRLRCSGPAARSCGTSLAWSLARNCAASSMRSWSAIPGSRRPATSASRPLQQCLACRHRLASFRERPPSCAAGRSWRERSAPRWPARPRGPPGRAGHW